MNCEQALRGSLSSQELLIFSESDKSKYQSQWTNADAKSHGTGTVTSRAALSNLTLEYM